MALQENGAQAVGRCITFHDEGLGEVRQGEDRRRRDGGLEGVECNARLVGPREPLLAEKGRKGQGNRVVLFGELAVVARQPKKTTYRTS